MITIRIKWRKIIKIGKQDAVVEELFRNYFSEEKFIGDRAVLLAAAEKVCIRYNTYNI